MLAAPRKLNSLLLLLIRPHLHLLHLLHLLLSPHLLLLLHLLLHLLMLHLLLLLHLLHLLRNKFYQKDFLERRQSFGSVSFFLYPHLLILPLRYHSHSLSYPLS